METLPSIIKNKRTSIKSLPKITNNAKPKDTHIYSRFSIKELQESTIYFPFRRSVIKDVE